MYVLEHPVEELMSYDFDWTLLGRDEDYLVIQHDKFVCAVDQRVSYLLRISGTASYTYHSIVRLKSLANYSTILNVDQTAYLVTVGYYNSDTWFLWYNTGVRPTNTRYYGSNFMACRNECVSDDLRLQRDVYGSRNFCTGVFLSRYSNVNVYERRELQFDCIEKHFRAVLVKWWETRLMGEYNFDDLVESCREYTGKPVLTLTAIGALSALKSAGVGQGAEAEKMHYRPLVKAWCDSFRKGEDYYQVDSIPSDARSMGRGIYLGNGVCYLEKRTQIYPLDGIVISDVLDTDYAFSSPVLPMLLLTRRGDDATRDEDRDKGCKFGDLYKHITEFSECDELIAWFYAKDDVLNQLLDGTLTVQNLNQISVVDKSECEAVKTDEPVIVNEPLLCDNESEGEEVGITEDGVPEGTVVGSQEVVDEFEEDTELSENPIMPSEDWQKYLELGLRGMFGEFGGGVRVFGKDFKRIADSLELLVKKGSDTDGFKLLADKLDTLVKALSIPATQRASVIRHSWQDMYIKFSTNKGTRKPLDTDLYSTIYERVWDSHNVLLMGYAGTGKGEIVMRVLEDLSNDLGGALRFCYVSCHGNTSHLDLGYGDGLHGAPQFGAVLEGMYLAMHDRETKYVLVLDEMLSCSLREALGACMNLLSEKGNTQVYSGELVENVDNFSIIATGNRGAMYNAGTNIDEAIESRFDCFDILGLNSSATAIDTYFENEASLFGDQRDKVKQLFQKIHSENSRLGINMRILKRVGLEKNVDYVQRISEEQNRIFVGYEDDLMGLEQLLSRAV